MKKKKSREQDRREVREKWDRMLAQAGNYPCHVRRPLTEEEKEKLEDWVGRLKNIAKAAGLEPSSGYNHYIRESLLGGKSFIAVARSIDYNGTIPKEKAIALGWEPSFTEDDVVSEMQKEARQGLRKLNEMLIEFGEEPLCEI